LGSGSVDTGSLPIILSPSPATAATAPIRSHLATLLLLRVSSEIVSTAYPLASVPLTFPAPLSTWSPRRCPVRVRSQRTGLRGCNRGFLSTTSASKVRAAAACPAANRLVSTRHG